MRLLRKIKYTAGVLIVRLWLIGHRLSVFFLKKIPGTPIYDQERNLNSIPVIIINFNQLAYLKELIDALQNYNHERIVIIDNASTYPPLLEYYEQIGKYITIHRLTQNIGHMVFWKNKKLFKQYGRGYYVLTDADILPNKNLPLNYIMSMKKLLDETRNIVKVGFALNIEDIPDHYKLKEKIITLEKKYWEDQIAPDIYRADVDTTFALYKPGLNLGNRFMMRYFYTALRVGGDFTCRHGGWYIDHNRPTPEQSFYMKTANLSSSGNTLAMEHIDDHMKKNQPDKAENNQRH